MDIGIRYKSVEARKYSNAPSQVNIGNNSTIQSLSKFNGKLSIGFVFTSNYEPNVGVIRIEGELMYSDEKDEIERISHEWEQSGRKKIPDDKAQVIHNTILSNCIVEAAILSRDIQLPPPFPTPQVSFGDKGKGEKVAKDVDRSQIDYIR